MSEKKYYWLKLQRDFFKRHDIRIIESMPNGKDYILFYLKLLVESIDHEGFLRFSDTIPYNEEMLSTITSTNIDIVRSAMKVFEELEMVEILDDSTIFMSEVDKMIGSSNQDEHTRESTRRRVANFRKRQKQLSVEETQKRYSNVTCNGEIDIEKEKDKEIEIDNNIVEIVDYLNLVCHTNYRSKTPKTQKHINARLREGFTVDDFKMVIDKKANEWLDTSMEQYLRPDTLFGTKFESYLNQNIVKGNKSTKTEEQAKEDWLKKWENA